jgi:uncharacterized small protein (DUF1192 family)
MDGFDFMLAREQAITLTGVNRYIITDFEQRIGAIVKELENLKAVKNKAGRQEITERINNLYRGNL